MAIPVDRAKQLGAVLRERRRTLGISMTAAAEAAGMSRVTWHRLERGETGVAWGLMLAAAAALGMDLQLSWPGGHAADRAAPDAPAGDVLPLEIHLADFPGLRMLAWQVGEGVERLTPREAFGLYERNERHLDEASLSPRELSLLRALRTVFDGSDS